MGNESERNLKRGTAEMRKRTAEKVGTHEIIIKFSRGGKAEFGSMFCGLQRAARVERGGVATGMDW